MSVYDYYQRKVTERRIRESSENAKRERQVRDLKDLANVAYMGKNE